MNSFNRHGMAWHGEMDVSSIDLCVCTDIKTPRSVEVNVFSIMSVNLGLSVAPGI